MSITDAEGTPERRARVNATLRPDHDAYAYIVISRNGNNRSWCDGYETAVGQAAACDDLYPWGSPHIVYALTPVWPNSEQIEGRVSGADLTPIAESHPVEWLRGKAVVEIVCDVADLRGVKIGGAVAFRWVKEGAHE